MKRSRKAGLGLFLLTLALAAACTRQSKPLAVPELADVESIYVTKMKGGAVVWRYETQDRGRIAAILEHLREHNPDEYRIETRLYARTINPRLPDHDYDILFVGPGGYPLTVVIGPDWLGGKDDLEDFTDERRLNLYRRRPLNASERAALVPLLETRPGDENMVARD